MANTKNTTEVTKETTASKKAQEEIAELKKQNAQLQSKIDEMMTFLSGLKSGMSMQQPVQEIRASSVLNEEITIVHLREREVGLSTHIVLSNLVLDFTRFGETRVIDRRQAEELVSRCRKQFINGTLAIGNENSDFAKIMQVNTLNAYSNDIGADFLVRLGSLSLFELEELYNKVCDGFKSFIIEYFKRKVIEKDPNFKNIHKIEMLNRVSDGAMSGTLLDLKTEKERETSKK